MTDTAHRPPTARPLLLCLLLLALAAPVVATSGDGPVSADEYAQRRQRVIETIGPDALLVLVSPEPAPRNGDVTWPFRQDDDLLYLTGVAEPDTALVLLPGEERFREVLFARDRDPRTEVWNGPIPAHDELAAASGIAEVHSADAVRAFLGAALNGDGFAVPDTYRYYRRPAAPRFLQAVREGRAEVWLDLGWRPVGNAGPATPAGRLADDLRATWPEVTIRNATPLLSALREVKSPAEVALIERAIEVTEAAIRAGMRRAPTAGHEYELQATVDFTFRDLGACCWGFPSIVAAGSNTTVLHYPSADAAIPADGLVLFDVGAEVGGYTADISRTFPADGTFSEAQREIHDAVHRTWQALVPELRPGRLYHRVHLKAIELLGDELAALGLVTDPDSKAQVEMYFLHGLGHPLGLQVHDVFDRTRELEPGMVWTLEPGLYVRPDDVEASETFRGLSAEEQATIRQALERYAGIGVRIEDDLLITDGAPRVLSDGTPRSAEEIERFMAAVAP